MDRFLNIQPNVEILDRFTDFPNILHEMCYEKRRSTIAVYVWT